MEQEAKTAYKPNFKNWWERGFGPRLVGVIPHDAKLAPDTKVSEANRGKVPGRLRENGWVGLGGSFINRPKTTQEEAKRWQKDGAGVGVFAQHLPGLDIDVNDEMVARAIQELAFEHLGDAPVRTRKKSSRRLLPYRSKAGDIRKLRITFKIGDELHAVELLGAGNYYNISGIHPSGESYVWRGENAKAFTVGSLTEIDDKKINAFVAALGDYLDTMGYPIVKHTKAGSSSADRKEIGNRHLQASNIEAVSELLDAVPCDETTFETRDDFIPVLAAIKASYGKAHEDRWPDVLDWALQYPGATEEYVTKIWESFKDTSVGWDYLRQWGRQHGYDDDIQRDYDEVPPEWADEAPCAAPNKIIKANPFIWQDPKTIPPREWLYGRHFARKYLSTTIAPGGVGKSALLTVELLAMATGKNLLGELPKRPLRAWYWNGEDPMDDLQRRFTAACLHHKVSSEDIGGRLFLNSGRDTPIVLARDERSGLEHRHADHRRPASGDALPSRSTYW